MRIAIIDYGSGNLRSAAKAFERMAAETGADADIAVTADPDTVAGADRVVLPGVGAFADCLAGIEAIAGMRDALEDAVRRRARPFLGICIGMQLMADVGREHGDHAGLGWLAGEVVPIRPADPALKVPHMGWNELIVESAHPLLAGIGTGDHAYFVHSYQLRCAHDRDRLAHVDYGGPVTAMVGHETMAGTQFHPEKSQAVGLRLIANFLAWSP